jgi:quercetin dioxygenase-like cupin family protein
MRKLRVRDAEAKGWLAGPWESSLPVGVGFANGAIDAPHRHERTTEIYLVAAGTVTATVDGAGVPLGAGDVVIVEPHEVRSFRGASADYRCFVVHVGGDGPDRVDVSAG